MAIVARDHGVRVRSSSASITVHVTDIADSSPLFNMSSYAFSVSEAESVGGVVGEVLATSRDSPPLDSVRYEIVEGGGVFQLVADTTGVLTLREELDFETRSTYRLIIQARSALNSDLLRTEVPVTVTVTNSNEHPPVFPRASYNVSVLTTSPRGTHVVTVSAHDQDSGGVGVVRYAISNDTDPEARLLFRVDEISGEIHTQGVLTIDTLYQLTIDARDGDAPPLIGHVTVNIHVEDEIGTRPTFVNFPYSVHLNESSEPGDIIRVIAVDQDGDGGQLTYVIERGNVANTFTVGSNGMVRTLRGLDREERGSYELLLVVSDGLLESNATLSITVDDVNDHAPQFTRSSYIREVPEDAREGEELLRVVAMDADKGANGRVAYSIHQQSPQDLFKINRSDGSISLRAGQRLDYEDSPQEYELVVIATDSELDSAVMVVIRVLDVNDNRPVFNTSLPSSLVISEDRSPYVPLLEVSATDADSGVNAHVRYWLSGDGRALRAFALGEDSGTLYATRSLDRETRDTYMLTIHASDSGATPLSSSALLTVTVSDVVDYPPVFSRASYAFVITSLRPINASLGQVVASTRDLAPSSIRYSILPGATGNGSDASLFTVDETTGVLTTLVELDPAQYEGVYTLEVLAQHSSLSSSVPVGVTISADNLTPRLHPFSVRFNAYTSLFPATPSFLGTVRVLNTRPTTTYTFSLHPSSSSLPSVLTYFRVDASSGALYVFNNVSSGVYQLNVSATAYGGERGYGLVSVRVTLLTNATLDNSVLLRFPGVSVTTFAQRWLESFSIFITERIAAACELCVEVYGLQASRDDPALPVNTTELALAVRSHDYISYIPTDHLQALLLSDSLNFDLSTFAPSLSSMEVETSTCASDMCPNLQRCRPHLQLRPHNATASLNTLVTEEQVYLSHPFAPGHVCTCPQGYSRTDLCSTELDECSPNPCFFGAECVDLVGDYQCVCPSATTGKNCSVVCPSESCDPCDPNPCLYGGECVSSHATHTCMACPSDQHAGPNCELTSARFTAGSYLALPSLSSTVSLEFSLRFATVHSSGMLAYVGRYDDPGVDYVSVEVLVGQVRVGVSLGGVATVLRTSSEQRLNDGAWHRVDVQINNRVSEFSLMLILCCWLFSRAYCIFHAVIFTALDKISQMYVPLLTGCVFIFWSSGCHGYGDQLLRGEATPGGCGLLLPAAIPTAPSRPQVRCLFW